MTLRLTLIFLLTLLTLIGCSSKGSKTQIQHQQQLIVEDFKTANYWFQLARNTTTEEKATYYLNGVAVLINAQQNLEAQEFLKKIFELPLSVNETKRWQLYNTISLINQDNIADALLQFSILTRNSESTFSIEDQKTLLIHYAKTYALSGNFIEALKKRIQLSAILEPNLQQQNNDAIWNLLQKPTEQYLRLFDDSPTENRVVQGWINLALINKTHMGHPRELMSAISLWRERFAQHPALKMMPSSISELSSANLIEPENIAILLPQTGTLANIGKIIRKGIEAAYLENKRDPKATLRFYDSNTTDIVSLYQVAVAEGAEFVIGPLQKNAIDTLLKDESLNTPILVLNMSDNELIGDIKAYQFGLPIENEVRQVAEKIRSYDLDRAAVLVPNTTTGDRALQAFKEQFERLDGKVVAQKHYLNGRDYSKVIRSLLAIDSSKKRHRELQKTLGQTVIYEERRRKDIDSIFLFAGVDEGRRLKPLLDYYYAQNIPVFSTSNIFQGGKKDLKNKDLEKVTFMNIPWLVSDSDQNQTLKNNLSNFWPETVTGSNARFFAFGYDAFNLISELAVLEVFPLQYLDGKTGRLFLNSKKQMARDLPWVKFRRGKLSWQGYLDDSQKIAN
jgi:hypothetical protein